MGGAGESPEGEGEGGVRLGLAPAPKLKVLCAYVAAHNPGGGEGTCTLEHGCARPRESAWARVRQRGGRDRAFELSATC